MFLFNIHAIVGCADNFMLTCVGFCPRSPLNPFCDQGLIPRPYVWMGPAAVLAKYHADLPPRPTVCRQHDHARFYDT